MKKILNLAMVLILMGSLLCAILSSCGTSEVEQKAINAVKEIKDSLRDPDSLRITAIRYRDSSNLDDDYENDTNYEGYEDEYVLLIKAYATNGFGGYDSLDIVVTRNNKILTSEDDDTTVMIIHTMFMDWDELSNHELDAEKILKKANE